MLTPTPTNKGRISLYRYNNVKQMHKKEWFKTMEQQEIIIKQRQLTFKNSNYF